MATTQTQGSALQDVITILLSDYFITNYSFYYLEYSIFIFSYVTLLTFLIDLCYINACGILVTTNKAY